MQPRARPFSLEHGELLPQGQDLDCSVLSSAEEDSHGGEGNQDEFKHEILRSTICNTPRARQPKLLILVNDEVLATHNHLVERFDPNLAPSDFVRTASFLNAVDLQTNESFGVRCVDPLISQIVDRLAVDPRLDP